MSLSPEAWEDAGTLLQPPPLPERAGPFRGLPLSSLVASLDAAHTKLAGDGSASLQQSDLPGLALALLERGGEREQLRSAADALRRSLVGDGVTFVVNRNLNTSNHCVLRCHFCAFRRDGDTPGAYRLPLQELEGRAAEAQRVGATELCLQAGLDPEAQLGGSHLAFAVDLLLRLRQAAPGIHLHAFSPQELLFIAERDGLPLDRVLVELQAAGLGSVPGTAAEVLSDPVRRLICPEKLSARAWVAVILQVHRQRLATTATLMAGHLESAADRAAHLLTLVAVQQDAHRRGLPGFSEFVLLPFVGAAAPAPLRRKVGRDQPDPAAMLALTAQCRLLLGSWFVHHQPSWVKLTLPVAAEALRWGCDDLGGTLMEEHITTMAGALGGTRQTPATLRAAAARLGRPALQRTTLYGRAETANP
ncbi:CofH family radical SAM protein [Synechococcus sp. CCY 9618]|uniref:CofH family radical SAM protein n=1 Tax=Synechococcus sp. CCY 9618 TaxID=2815602 RepID=UPI00352E78E2